MLCSYYLHSNIKSGELPLKNAKLSNILDAIKNGHWRDELTTIRNLLDSDPTKANDIKNSLPCFKISGTFNGGSDADLQEYNGLLQIDIDKIPPQAIETIRTVLSSLNYVVACFLSPRLGIKAIVKTDVPNISNGEFSAYHKAVFESLEGVLNGYLNQYSIDTSTKSISKNCYVSFDSDLYYNSSATPYEFKYIPQIITPKKRAVPAFGGVSTSHRGGKLQQQQWDTVYHQLDKFLPEMLFSWSDKKSCWISSKNYGGVTPNSKNNPSRTVAELGIEDGIVLKEVGNRGLGIQTYMRQHQSDNMPIKTIKKYFGWWR